LSFPPHDPHGSRPENQAGFTLVEVLVVATLVSIVGALLMWPLVLSGRAQQRDANYAYSQQEARTGLESMVAQIREARYFNGLISTSLSTMSFNTLDFVVDRNQSDLRIVYECDIPQPGTNGAYNECVRAQSTNVTVAPSVATGTVVVRNLLNGSGTDPVFTLGPSSNSPYYMTATIKQPASGGTSAQGGTAYGLQHQIVFTDGALMRNLNVLN
jgi:prepilin-type N-terminal cleavage/methylation domain-containing protein